MQHNESRLREGEKMIDDIKFLLKIDELKDFFTEENVIVYHRKNDSNFHFSKNCFNEETFETSFKSLKEINDNLKSFSPDCLQFLHLQEKELLSSEIQIKDIIKALQEKEAYLQLLKTSKNNFKENMQTESFQMYFEELQLLISPQNVGELETPFGNLQKYFDELDNESKKELKEIPVLLSSDEMFDALITKASDILASSFIYSVNPLNLNLPQKVKNNIKTLKTNLKEEYKVDTSLKLVKTDWLLKQLKAKTAHFTQWQTYYEFKYGSFNSPVMMLPNISLTAMLFSVNAKVTKMTSSNVFEIESLTDKEFETLNSLILTTPSVKKAYMIAKTI